MAWFVLASAFLGPAAAPNVVWAQAKAATSQDSDEAARLYAEGVKAAEAGEWEKARAAFLKAWWLVQHAKIAAHLGRAELKTEHYREAAEHLSYSLRHGQDIGEAHQKDVREMLAQALAKVAVVTVRVNVDKAELLVDGRSVGRSPLTEPVYVEPGHRRFEAKQDGHLSVAVTEEVRAGGISTVELSIKNHPTSARSAEGLNEGAKPNKKTPAASTESGKGAYRGVVIAGGVSATALTVLGVVLMFKAEDKLVQSDELRGPPANPSDSEEYSRLDAERVSLSRYMAASFIAGSVVGTATLLTAVIWSPNIASEPRTAGTRVSVSGLGVSFASSW